MRTRCRNFGNDQFFGLINNVGISSILQPSKGIFKIDNRDVLTFEFGVFSDITLKNKCSSPNNNIIINFANDNHPNKDDTFNAFSVEFSINDFFKYILSDRIVFISKYWYNDCEISMYNSDNKNIIDTVYQIQHSDNGPNIHLSEVFYGHVVCNVYSIKRTDFKTFSEVYSSYKNDNEEYTPSDEELERAKYETNNDIKNDPCPNGPEGYSNYYSTPTSESHTLLRSDKLKEIVDNDADNTDKSIEKATNYLLSSIRTEYESLNREINEVINKKTEIILKDLSNFYKDLKEDISINKDHILMNRELIIDIAKTVNHTNVYVQGETPWNRKLDDKIINRIEEISSALNNVNSITDKLSNIESELSAIKQYTHDTICSINRKFN